MRKYMRQPYMMKLERINKYEKYLLSEVVTNSLAYFLNPLYLCPKNPIQFVVIEILKISHKHSKSVRPQPSESFQIFLSL
jgi:hypothetical protein